MGQYKDQYQQLVSLVQAAIAQDEALRQQFGVGDKFKFVRDKLHAILEDLQSQAPAEDVISVQHAGGMDEDEVTVYIYLFNAQGVSLPTWRNMLTPKLFYEYSVNRPIYSERSHIVSLTKSKAIPAQHGFLTVVIKQRDILRNGGEAPKDALDHPILKVREGSLQFSKLVMFTHNDIDYRVKESGEMTPKQSDE